ncbi:MAG TPA: PEP-CTERM sorting domain-containing protein [Tepidisphaeraceae bacterium]|nr:PEP-CTERM sorting domain-containing protein [Tepidisphaeraceae bacterium]
MAALFVVAGRVNAAMVTFNFADGTSDGWADGGFSTSPLSTVTAINGSNYIAVPIGGFQVANVSSGDTSSAFFQAMAAAQQNPSGYDLSYNWYVNTASFTATPTSFLQVGSFVNDGAGDYSQDFGSVKEVQLSGAQLTSGNIFQGQVSVNFATAGLTLATPGQTFYRLGFIENGDSGPAYVVDFTNISISPIPEPASLGLLSAGALALIRRRRRQV